MNREPRRLAPWLCLILALPAGAVETAPLDLKAAFEVLRHHMLQEAAIRESRRSPQADPRAKPQDSVMRIISWNIQTWGSSVKAGRREAYAAILGHMFSENRTARVLAIQEIAHTEGAQIFRELLPGGAARWNPSFQDSTDSQDNGFYSLQDVRVDCDRLLFARTSGGQTQPDKSRSLHPARVAHMHIGDLDFTIVTLHLTFEGGDADAARRELRAILDWLQEYFADPKSDPDLILAGDFNLPTRKGKASSLRAREAGWHPVEDIIDEYPLFRPQRDGSGRRVPKRTELIALVDDQTSRQQGQPANNYDHFIVSGDLWDEEFVQGSAGRMPANYLHAVEKEKKVYVSDHYPISAGLKTAGPGNDKRRIRRDGNGLCSR